MAENETSLENCEITTANIEQFIKAFRSYCNVCEKFKADKNEKIFEIAIAANEIYKKIYNYLKDNKVLNPKDLALIESRFADKNQTISNKDYEGLSQIKNLHLALAGVYTSKAEKLNNENKFVEALDFARNAIIYNPNDVFTNYELARSLNGIGASKEAADSFETVVRLDKNYIYGRKVLAGLYMSDDIGDYDKALANYGMYVKERPEDAHAWGEYGRCAYTLGIQDICEEATFKALELNPQEYSVAETYLLNLLKMDCYTRTEIRQKTEYIVERCLKAKNVKKYAYNFKNRKKPNKRLKIGYLSSDFNNHVVSKFLLPVIENHDKNKYEFYLFSIAKKEDNVTENYKKCVAADHFIPVHQWDVDKVSEKIYEEQIDILIDLNVHTGNSRMLTLGYKPAPVQAVWLGYPNTSGLDTVDYILTDRDTIHPGEEEFYTETPAYIDAGYEIFRLEKSSMSDLTAPPYKTNKYITLGVFNAVAKVNNKMIRVWAEILKKAKNTKIVFQYINAYTAGNRERIWKKFEENGIPRDRVAFLEKEGSMTHMDCFAKADIALDTNPYSGTGTTIDCLLMGLPIICLEGDSATSRPTSRMLKSMGRFELIAKDEDDYVEKALNLIRNPKLIDKYRDTLRTELQNSRLTDYIGFTRSLEKTYDRMWSDYCNSNK